MVLKIWKYICMIISFIFSWLKDLFKKDNHEIKENDTAKKDKEPLLFIKNIIDTCIPTNIDSSINKDVIKLDDDIKELLRNVDNISYNEIVSKIKTLDKKVVTIKKKEEKVIPKTKKEEVIHSNTLNILKEQTKIINSLENIYIPKKDLSLKTIKGSDDISKEVKEEQKKDIIEVKEDIPALKKGKKSSKKEKNKKEDINTEEEINNIITKIDEKKIEYSSYIIDSNKLIKEAILITKEIDYELTLNKNNLDNLNYKVKELKEKISIIKKKYEDFKNSDYYYIIAEDFRLNELDEFKIIQDDKNIDLYLNKCNSLLQMIEYKKYFVKEEKKESKKIFKPKKPVLEEQPKVEIPKIVIEIEEANNLIKKEIINEKKELKKINQKLLNVPIYERRGKKLNIFDNILNTTFKIGISFLPIKLFRNKSLGLLTTGFILNNRLRTMRRILNSNIECDYIEFNRRIKNQIDIVNGYSTICNDSLYQISSLKDEFIKIYGNNIDDIEIRKTFVKLVTLEEQITKQRDEIVNTKIRLNNKIKVKKRYYN